MSKKLKHITNKFPGRSNPFGTPEDYFQSFPDRLLDRIEEQEQSTFKSTLIRYLKPLLAMAASFALIFMLIYFPVKTMKPNSAKTDKSEVLDQDLLPYMVSDEVLYESFHPDSDQEIDDSVIETVLLASVSDLELMNM